MIRFRVLRGLMLLWLPLLLVLGHVAPASAHWADMAAAEVVVDGAEARMTLTFPTGLAAMADDDGNGRLSSAEVVKHRGALEARLGEAVRLSSGDRTGKLSVEPVAEATGTPGAQAGHSTLLLRYGWDAPVTDVALHYGLFLPGVDTAHCLVSFTHGEQVTSAVLTPERREVQLGGAGAVQQAVQFIGLGVEHILIGYDHILFLIALLMLGGGLGYLIKMVTAFTVAHSVTLSLAFFNVLTLPPRLVESAIALSVVYVAAETFWRKDIKGRWLLALVFGLVHGLGFASVLKELEVPASNVALSLASFNVGVELGQLVIVGTAFGLLSLIRKQPWELNFRRWVSAGVCVMGLVWFVERAFIGI